MTAIDVPAGHDERLRAARVAARSQIRDVRLMKGNFESFAFPSDGQLVYDLAIGSGELEWDEGDSSFAVGIEYELTLAQTPDEDDQSDEGDEGEDKQMIASMTFTFAGLFTLDMREDDEPATPDEMTAYANTTASFALYPFVREYVYNMTGRLRLPSLTLGVLLQSVSAKEVADR